MRYLVLFLILPIFFIVAGCASHSEDHKIIRDLNSIIADPIHGSHIDSQTGTQNALYALNELMGTASTDKDNIDQLNIRAGGILNLPLYIMHGRTMPDEGLTGLLHPFLASNTADRAIADIITPTLLARNNDGLFILGDDHHGPIILHADLNNNTLTFTMCEDVQIFWHDGVELTLSDLVFAYEFIASLPSFRALWGAVIVDHIIGVHDFRAGKNDYITGLELSDDKRQLTIHYYYMPFSLLQHRFLGTPLPRHHFEYIPDEALLTHVNSRENIIGFGAFMLSDLIINERVVLVANPYYWQGTPYVYGINFYFMNDMSAITTAFIRGDIDAIDPFFIDTRSIHLNDNINVVNQINDFHYFYFFNLGVMFMNQTDFNNPFIESIPRDDNHPITNRYMRQALSLAMNHQYIIETQYDGMGVPATSFLHPVNASSFITDSIINTLSFDIERANRILDEAGFRWGQEEFRLDLKGNPFYVTISLSNTINNTRRFNRYRQDFLQIGVDLRLYTGNFLNRMHTQQFGTTPYPNSNLHIMATSSWRVFNNSLHFFWSGYSFNNSSGYKSPTLNSILDDLSGENAWDYTLLFNTYRRFDEYMLKNLPGIPGPWFIASHLVNRRVANWRTGNSMYMDGSFSWHLINISE